MESSSSYGSCKRARAPNTSTQVSSCLVDGCKSDLSKCRDYHKRHKVCELHSKTPKVKIKGQEQRFCQQCSRFHSLVEFDEGKRSCRKRLDGHNRRRRKPQPHSLSIASGKLFTNYQGVRYAHFANAQFPSANLTSSTWSRSIKTENNTIDDNNHIFESETYKIGKQFPFLESNSSTTLPPVSSFNQAHLDTSSSIGCSGGRQKMLPGGLNRIINFGCALSLLSSPSTTENPEMVVQPALDSQKQTLNMPNLQHYNELGVGVESINGSCNNNNLHWQDIFLDGSSSSATSTQHTLSFSWE